MSSIHRAASQIESRVAFFIALGSGQLYTIANAAAVMPAATLPVQGASISAGNLYRDMGKTVVILDASGLAAKRYRLVQRVNGADTEGVDAAAEYALVWAADGTAPVLARLG